LNLIKARGGYRLIDKDTERNLGPRYHAPKEFNAFVTGCEEMARLGNLADFLRKEARLVQLKEALGHLIDLTEGKLDPSEPIEGAEELTNADAFERFKMVLNNQLRKERICICDGSGEK